MMYGDNSKNRFLASRKTQKSVILGLEIIGEATKNLSKEFTSKVLLHHPEAERGLGQEV